MAAPPGGAGSVAEANPRLVGSRTASAEALKGLLCGVAFGVASPLASHPLDTLKTRMQALPGAYAQASSLEVLRATVREGGGLRSLYRGLAPPLVGSVIYRASQFGVYAGTYSALTDHDWATAEIPGLWGLQYRVPLAGAVATTARALIETPLEVLKIRAQCGLPRFPAGAGARVAAQELSRGFGITWLRLYCALGGFFILVDHAERHHGELIRTPYVGSFIKGGICATAAWWVAWPFEVVKSRVQAQSAADAAAGPPSSILARLRTIVKERGFRGLYRGIGPGTARSIVGNGAAFTAFDLCARLWD